MAFTRTYSAVVSTLVLLIVHPGQPAVGNSERASQPKPNLFRNAMHYDDAWFDGSDLYSLPEMFAESDLDIFAAALRAMQVRRAASMPVPNENIVNRFAIDAAFLNECNGDLASSDKYSKMITNASFAYNRPQAFFMCMAFDAAGQTRNSELLHKADPYMQRKRTPEQRLNFKDDIQAEEQIKIVYPLTAQCLDAIASGDRAGADCASAKLMNFYANEPIDSDNHGWDRIKKQKLFCTMLNIARKYSDRKWVLQSTNILEQTLAIAEKKGENGGRGLLIAELLVNEERQGHENINLCDLLFQECLMVSVANAQGEKAKKPYEWSTSEKLRRLASAYYQVGDYSRADVFLSRALKSFKSQEDNSSGIVTAHCRGTGVAGDKVLLLLQAACLRAKQSNFEQAGKFAAEALAGPAPEEYGYGAKLVDLAQTYRVHGDIQKAIDLLLKARQKNIPDVKTSSTFHTSRYLVNYWLSDLLYEQGKIKESRSIIEPAIAEENANDQNYASCILAGNCAKDMHDYAMAALRYEKAALSRNLWGLPDATQPDIAQAWLRKSVAAAELAKTINAEDLGRIYYELAKQLPAGSEDEANNLFTKARTLLPVTSPERIKMLEEASRHAGEFSSNKIALAREVAATSERAHSSEACKKYVILASIEANAGQFDEAIADCRHAILLYDNDSSAYFSGRRSSTFPDSNLINLLVRQNRQVDAEKLMVESTQRAVSACGPDSVPAATQRSALLSFYIEQKDNDKALLTLDSLLSGDMSIYDMSASTWFHSSPPNLGVVYDWALVKTSGDSKLSLKILNKTLEAQKKQLKSDNFQFVATYDALAMIKQNAGDNAAALEDCRKAIAIASLYLGEAQAIRRNNIYVDLLKKTGDVEAAARIEARYNAPSAADTIEQQKEREVRETRLSNDLIFLKSQCEKSKAEAPYSIETQILTQKLFTMACKEKNWPVAHTAADSLSASEDHHMHDRNGNAYLEQQFAAMCLAEGNLDAARKWFDKMVTTTNFKARRWDHDPCDLVKAYIYAGRIGDACHYIRFLLDGKKADAPYLVAVVTGSCSALMHKGSKVQAKQILDVFFDKSAEWIPLLDKVKTATDLAYCAIEAGETGQIGAVLDRAEVIAATGDGNLLLPELSRLWRQIKMEQKAVSVDSKYQSYLAKIGGSKDLLVCGIKPSKNSASTVQTRIGANFSVATSMAKYPFVFALLASHSLILESHVSLCQSPGGAIAFAGSYGELKCKQTAAHFGSVSFISSSAPVAGATIPPVQSMPFKEIFVPTQINLNYPNWDVTGADREYKEVGDVRISTVDVGCLSVDSHGKGLLRIYFDEAKKAETVFHLQAGGRANARIPGGKAPNDSNLELWYSGNGTIKLDRDSTFNGNIYAPNAHVEIGPGHATFAGAIVAKDIVVTGESRIFANSDVSDWSSFLK